jgi:thiol-disulfide isomerase/thioredoxin
MAMPWLTETVYAPELEGGHWIQGGPIRLGDLRAKAVVLLDFWDYTCINCIHTLPYIAQWHQRYHASGLVIVGVHAPEFSFARNASHVEHAVRSFNLDYPVVLDNDFAIWRAYSNRYWPAKYLVDANGRVRYYHFGEGGYAETERAIRQLLQEMKPGSELSPMTAAAGETDRPGGLHYCVTPELYLGYARGRFGNPEGVMHDREYDYPDPGRHVEGLAYLAGLWRVEQECARAQAEGATLRLRYTAREVNLVMAPRAGAVLTAQVALAGSAGPGADVSVHQGRAVVTVERPRMYNLATSGSVDQGALELRAEHPGLALYAFTFTSCAVAR